MLVLIETFGCAFENGFHVSDQKLRDGSRNASQA